MSETAANLPGRTQTWCLFCCPIQKKTVSMSTLGPEWLFFALEEIIYSKQCRWLKRSRNYANILKLKTGFAPNVQKSYTCLQSLEKYNVFSFNHCLGCLFIYFLIKYSGSCDFASVWVQMQDGGKGCIYFRIRVAFYG